MPNSLRNWSGLWGGRRPAERPGRSRKADAHTRTRFGDTLPNPTNRREEVRFAFPFRRSGGLGEASTSFDLWPERPLGMAGVRLYVRARRSSRHRRAKFLENYFVSPFLTSVFPSEGNIAPGIILPEGMDYVSPNSVRLLPVSGKFK